MSRGYVDALVETAPEGISFDGLAVSFDGEYRFETPDAEIEALSESALREVAAGSPYATNWYFWHAVAPQKADRWAFLRYLEDGEQSVRERYDRLSEGISATWGQLQIGISLGEDGHRRYQLRHREDSDRESGDADNDDSPLDQYTNPLAARNLAKFTDSDSYRPLKGAPNLQRGWEFRGLGPAELVETVDFFYPATVTNWHREREGELDVTHWEETMARQTGMYGLIETWDRGDGHEHVEWVAESCCRDSECLKRREWQYDEETSLDTPGGEGEFPCREPCSVVISAARRFTKLDAEETREYEFELTPSEKTQLEELIDAVADGTVDEIRDADLREGANRLRARFLRARRFDEDGRLCGVGTEEDGTE